MSNSDDRSSNSSSGSNHWWSIDNIRDTSHPQQLVGKEKKRFFREHYLDNHSREIAKIICENWTKESGLFASCVYENGVKHINQPFEPPVTKFGLARYHLMFGYQHDAWDFYRAGKDESVGKAKEIETIIDEYESIVIDEIEKSIDTRKLEKKRKNEVFFGSYFPPKFEFNSLYLYPEILSEIFKEVHNRTNGKENRKYGSKRIMITNTWLSVFKTPLNVANKN